MNRVASLFPTSAAHGDPEHAETVSRTGGRHLVTVWVSRIVSVLGTTRAGTHPLGERLLRDMGVGPGRLGPVRGLDESFDALASHNRAVGIRDCLCHRLSRRSRHA